VPLLLLALLVQASKQQLHLYSPLITKLQPPQLFTLLAEQEQPEVGQTEGTDKTLYQDFLSSQGGLAVLQLLRMLVLGHQAMVVMVAMVVVVAVVAVPSPVLQVDH
jgi:hypothetical protein